MVSGWFVRLLLFIRLPPFVLESRRILRDTAGKGQSVLILKATNAKAVRTEAVVNAGAIDMEIDLTGAVRDYCTAPVNSVLVRC